MKEYYIICIVFRKNPTRLSNIYRVFNYSTVVAYMYDSLC